MRVQVIVVQLIGFEEVFHADYHKHLKIQLLEFRSKLFRFEIYREIDLADFDIPTISVVALSGKEPVSALMRKYHQCKSSKVVTVGSECAHSTFPNVDLHVWPEGLISKVKTIEDDERRIVVSQFISQSIHTVPGPLMI